MDNTTNIARLAVLEHQVKTLKESLDSLDKKMDELLQLRSKGMGAFWLASLLVGTGLFGFFTTMMSWMSSKGS